MTQLIVALDVDDPIRWHEVFHACRAAGVTFFKLNLRAFFATADPLSFMRANRCDVMLDLKLYDTADTVHAVARRAFDLGARFLTVHATPSMLEAAMRAKPPGDYHKVLAVGRLTDGSGYNALSEDHDDSLYDGVICQVRNCAGTRAVYPGKIIVCPGIRMLAARPNGHLNPATPAEAKTAGADYIVVGRPIYDAVDPVAAGSHFIDLLFRDDEA